MSVGVGPDEPSGTTVSTPPTINNLSITITAILIQNSGNGDEKRGPPIRGMDQLWLTAPGRLFASARGYADHVASAQPFHSLSASTQPAKARDARGGVGGGSEGGGRGEKRDGRVVGGGRRAGGKGRREPSESAVAVRGKKEAEAMLEQQKNYSWASADFDDDPFETNSSAAGAMGLRESSLNRTSPAALQSLHTPHVRLETLKGARVAAPKSLHSPLPKITSRRTHSESDAASYSPVAATARTSLPPSHSHMTATHELVGLSSEETKEYKEAYKAALEVLGSDVFYQALNLARMFSDGEVKVSSYKVCVCTR